MSTYITQAFQRIESPDTPSHHSKELTHFGQGDAFFQLAALKGARNKLLKAAFAGKAMDRVLLSANISSFDCRIPGCRIEYLEKDFFQEPDEAIRIQKHAHLKGAVVIVNNNDVGSNKSDYADFYALCDQTIFVAWDWDNHHWLDLSSFLAAHSDIYAPTHHEHLYLLSRYNWFIVGPIYACTVQWTRAFLAKNAATLITTSRSPMPLGMHIPYAAFNFRNRVVSTLNQHYSSIGFSDRSFHDRNPHERLLEWCGYKLHWIAPVLNDLPIRVFDALITGGIPIIPASLQGLAPVKDIPKEFMVIYGPNDIVNPRPLVERANSLFDTAGEDGIIARHRYALDYHHGDQRMSELVGFVRDIYKS